MNATPEPSFGHAPPRLRGWLEFVVALAVVAIGKLVVAVALIRAGSTLLEIASYALLLAGGALAARATWHIARAPTAATGKPKPGGSSYPWFARLGYKSFVAWRYLLVANRKVRSWIWWLLFAGLAALAVIALARAHITLNPGWDRATIVAELVLVGLLVGVVFQGVLPYSKLSLVLGLTGLIALVPAAVDYALVSRGKLPFLHLALDERAAVLPKFLIIAAIGAALTGIAMFFGCLRAHFTFFTTVPIGGVWIGTAALVVVLSVMGGFESDLREKILGSNAHLQITREDGEFTEWRKIKAQIDRMPGVVASTPYAVSEVVIAANNTGMNVIIKGIDPRTVGKVTDLVSDLEPEDHDAMQRLEPLIPDGHDLRVPQRPRTGPVIDPPPSDMPTPGDPIDYSGSAPAAGAHQTGSAPERRSAGGTTAPDPGSAAAWAPGERAGRAGAAIGAGGSATADDHDAADDAVRELVEGDPEPPRPREHAAPARREVVDPAPGDLVTTDEPPADYSRPDYLQDAVRVVDVPFDTPALSRRTQALPGILVGRELVKQTHLYTGEEVRVVSPLSDPSNPDATGTPIPFNRDYRVAGRFFTGMYEYDLKYVYVTLESLQDFLDRGDAVDGIEVRVSNPYETDAFVAQFQAALGSQYRVQDWKELNRSLFAALKLEKIAMFLVLGIVILVASFSIIGNLIMVVVEKAREIALLKTLGASDSGVMQLFAIQGLMIGAIGTLLGVATGLLGCWGLQEFGFPLNSDVYYIDRLPVHVDPASVAAAATAGIVISIAATLYPAVVAARVRPAAGMRH